MRFRIWVSSKLKTITARRDSAKRIRDVYFEKLKSGFNPFSSDLPGEISIVRAIEEVVQLKKSSHQLKTGHAYTVISKKLIKFIKANKLQSLKCYQFTKQHAVQFSRELITKNEISNATFNNNIIIIRAIFNKMIEYERIVFNPFTAIKTLPQEESSKKAFTKSEIHRLYNYLTINDPELLLICEIILYCGYRVKEVLSLQVRDIDLDNNVLRLQSKNHKNGRNRGMPMKAELREKMIKFKVLEDHYYLFGSSATPNINGTSLKPNTKAASYNIVQKRFKKVQKKLGIERTIYELKHTMATRLISENVNPMEIQQYLGHTNIENTLKYIRSVEETNAKKIQKFIPSMNDF